MCIRDRSIFAFSRENWSRQKEEVETLFTLLDSAIQDYTPDLIRQGVRVNLIGRMDELDPQTRGSVEEALRVTALGTRMVLNVCFNYSGRSEIVDAARRCLEDGLSPVEITEEEIANRLYTAGLPEPDL